MNTLERFVEEGLKLGLWNGIEYISLANFTENIAEKHLSSDFMELKEEYERISDEMKRIASFDKKYQ